MSGDEHIHANDLGGLLDPFSAYYRSDPEALADALREGVVIFDANALLDLYRFSPGSRDDLMRAIEAVRDRVFVPHRVALEFHKNHVRAVADRIEEYSAYGDRLSEIRGQAVGVLRQATMRAHGQGAASAEILDRLETLFEDLRLFVQSVGERYDLDPDTLAKAPPDPIVTRLAEVVGARVGREPSTESLETDEKEARRRIDERIPPGFGDRQKGDNASGDYLWWAESVRYAHALKPSAVVIVSNDVTKGDWAHTERGFRIGPRVELVQEMSEASGAALFLLTTSEFLAAMARTSLAEISEETLDEADLSPRRQVVQAIRDRVADSEVPIVSSAVANAALAVDSELSSSDWAGTGSFSAFLSTYVPELRLVNPPKPGYVFDPERHSLDDLPTRPAARERQGGAAVVGPDSWISPQLHDQLRRASEIQLSPETIDQLRRASEIKLSPEMLRQIREAAGIVSDPGMLDQNRRAAEVDGQNDEASGETGNGPESSD